MPKNPPRIAAGLVLSLPLEDGRFGACWVLAPGPASGTVLVEASAKIFDSPPKLDDVFPWRPLILTHHSWPGRREKVYVRGRRPSNFHHIGEKAPTAKDAAVKIESYTDWEYLPFQVLMQWRWENDRERVLAEDAAEEAAEARATEIAREKETARRSGLTLAKLRRKKPFSTWKRFVPAGTISKARKLVARCIASLETIGRDGPSRPKITTIRALIEGFNALDESMGHWIETEEREDNCAVVDDLARAAGLNLGDENIADRWRDW